MTESDMYVLDIKSSPLLTGQNNNREMSSIRLSLSTKTTWKLKTQGGILVFRVLVQVCSNAAWPHPSLLPWEVAGVIQTDGPGGIVSSYSKCSYQDLRRGTETKPSTMVT